MRETIAVVVCLLLFVIALQTGVVRTGMDYESIVKQTETLQAANDRLGDEVKRLLAASGETGVTLTAAELAALTQPAPGPDAKWREKVKTDINEIWADYFASHEAEWVDGPGSLSLRLSDKFLFSGAAPRLRAEARSPLQQVARVLQGLPDLEVRVVGYLDTPPGAATSLAGHAKRREASIERARAVSEFLETKGGLDPVRLVVAGRGDYQPLVSNDSDAHRARNRRIELELATADTRGLAQAHRLVRLEDTEKPRVAPSDEGDNGEESVGPEQLQPDDSNAFDAGYDKPAGK